MTIEKLTNEERQSLTRGDVLDGPKVLRLLDHAIEHAERYAAEANVHESECAALRAELTELNGELARMQKASNDARAELERLQAHLEFAQNARCAMAACGNEWRAQKVAAETRLAAAQDVYNERLAAWESERRTLLTSLAAATELLQKGKQFVGRTNGVREKWCDDADRLAAPGRVSDPPAAPMKVIDLFDAVKKECERVIAEQSQPAAPARTEETE